MLSATMYQIILRIVLPEINEKKNPVRIEINKTKDEVVKRHTTQEL